MKIEIENNIIECNVQYGKGKKLSIHIESTGFITIKAPKHTSEETIIKTVELNSKWILEGLQRIKKLKEVTKPKAYHEEGKFLHLGKEYLLHELIDNIELEEDELKKSLKKFYVSSCKDVVAKRIKIYEKQLGVKPKTVEITESKTHWGSCSSDKRITFNYRLAMAPVEVIDYVIVHELCHLMHMNHDRSFWRRVGSIIPDYKKKQEFLAAYGRYMTL
ncbi:M48 family metallopeptidase [Cellulosilyticum sp. I15G10I2]|uniref:M48 family metallopeptidase n=1 Tax=Cellulosilyticum sp. I15G10I2 TaxID=1892843 RepID=UPI00085C1AD2|nr:SprT family zinc-dependent metalloprotease [Cellulosilyticum sp. I15G10I2]